MLLDTYLDVEKLEEYVKAGYILRKQNESGNLTILNYSNKTTFDQLWDDVTCKTRGLIYETGSGRIIARPREKFFELNDARFPETLMENLPAKGVEVTDKLDGCAGTIYQYDGSIGVASRGSFSSPVAKWATKHYMDNYYRWSGWPKGHTPVVEIIWNGHPIVVSYPFDDLVLHGLIDIETGEEMPYDQLAYWADRNGMRCVELINQPISQLVKEDIKNKEGYVLSWNMGQCPPLKVKVKFEEYKSLSRMLKTTSVNQLWDMMRQGQDLAPLLDERMPSHYKVWVRKETSKIRVNTNYVKAEVKKVIDSLPVSLQQTLEPTREERKAIAEHFMANKQWMSLAFAYYDCNEKFDDMVYQRVKPHGNLSRTVIPYEGENG
jgi:RNA ligase